MDWMELVNSLGTALEIGIAVLLFASRLPRKEHFAARLAAFLLALAFFIELRVGSAAGSLDENWLQPFVTYTVVIAYCTLALPFLFETGVWQGLFCATIGYAMQNLSSGLGWLWYHVAARAGWGFSTRPLSIATTVVVYLLCYLLVVRRIKDERISVEENGKLFLAMLVVIFAVIGFDIAIKRVATIAAVPLPAILMLRAAHAVICCFVIFAEVEILHGSHLRAEVATMRQLAADERRQYELSKETIENINVKCHDIRHQIRQLADGRGGVAPAVDPAVLDDIAREVDVYDSRIQTGNEALDVILTERSLACEQKGITLSCMADGAAVGFMSPADIYSFFGNAMDNAIEAVERLEDPERRRISLVLRQDLGMASFHCENLYEGEVSFEDGLPQTSKADTANHGFGVLSMRRIAEKYGGMLVASAQDGTFMLDAAIPEP